MRTRYIAALAAVALLSITGQLLVQANLTAQESDSAVINLAGRQRMLSQRIVKIALIAVQPSIETGPVKPWRERLAGLMREWRAAHQGLRFGDRARGLPGENSAAVRAAFAELEVSYQGMNQVVAELLEPSGRDPDDIAGLLDYEDDFLRGMERIVSLYERESAARVRSLQRVELGLLALVLLTLLLEGLLVFRPAERRIREALDRLRAGEAEKSAILRAIPDTLVRVSRDGAIAASYALPGVDGPSSAALLERTPAVGKSVAALVGARHKDRCMAELEATIASGSETGFEFQVGGSGDGAGAPELHIEARLVPCEQEQALLILRDISAQRQLEREILLVVERERTRLGQDLHDGLCQHLAGLAMMASTLSSGIDEGKVRDAAELAPEMRTLAELLQSGLHIARQMSRGLFPEVLIEKGFEAALREVCATATRLHRVECVCEVELGGLEVAPNLAIQLYRVAQEAVGNAVRHARSESVTLSLRSDAEQLILQVADTGVGLRSKGREASAAGGTGADGHAGGIGLRSMAMRARSIGADFMLRDNEPTGTVVTCRLLLSR